jgi:hypothetical protein
LGPTNEEPGQKIIKKKKGECRKRIVETKWLKLYSEKGLVLYFILFGLL